MFEKPLPIEANGADFSIDPAALGSQESSSLDLVVALTSIYWSSAPMQEDLDKGEI